MISLIQDISEVLRWYLKLFAIHLSSFDPFVLAPTAVFCVLALGCWGSSNYKQLAFKFFRRLPGVNYIIQRKIDNAIADIYATIHGSHHVRYETRLPEDGLPSEKIMLRIRRYKAAEYIRWNEGYVSGAVYPREASLSDLVSRVFKEFIWTNPLHADVFPDIRRMEAEVVRMCVSMFHGDSEACGTTTSGGTESIMLACLAYRELARSKGIRNPRMIIPESAHPAFDKAAHYFCINVSRVPVDPHSMKVDMRAMRRAITENACMLVGSAPGFPHGVIDPIEEIALLGQRYGIPVHVDCCLGGFLLPFMESAGFPLEPFDFRLPGVTSISCDTHKYGFAAKGTSVIMYRNKHYRSMQFFTQPDWSGGLYASPTFAGSRSGALIAVCWATLMHYGYRGYVESTLRIVKTARYIANSLRKIPGIIVFGDPQISVVAFGSNVFNIYQLSMELSQMSSGRGWNLNNLQSPPAVHLCVTDLHTVDDRADRFLRDVRYVAEKLMERPNAPVSGAAAMYGMCATLPDRSIVSDVAKGFLDACYATPDQGVDLSRSPH